MNFNFSDAPEYDLHSSMIDEVINLYGIAVKFLIVSKINSDDLVFGDYSHLKTDSNKVYELFMLPEASDDWEASDVSFGQFGLSNFENVTLFVSKNLINETIPDIASGINRITGNIIVLPNNKIMEITNVSWEVPGINNLFTQKDAKSVIKLSCKPYDNKLVSELDPIDISVEPDVPYESLDNYFNELINVSDAQD